MQPLLTFIMQPLLIFIVHTLVMGYVRSAPVYAARHCRTSPILRAAIRNSQFAIRRMGEARHAPCKNPAKDRA